ncbi:uncharacterized protein LOC107263199 isoform X2 [Cephus cinctus]|uniref:Uncharacterized protein LOC107263199 isoform X2 n=1 Tax=Cephus cinctus TaxID=211228 RepID=A0AAJ7BHH4_CEPCN|nr:uncharacterized protein LOC107263199 isoform X2 [Cephus cinctus]
MSGISLRGVGLALLVALVFARSADSTGSSDSKKIVEDELGRSTSSGLLGELRSAYQLYKECSSSELSSCLKVKLLSAMDRASRSLQLNIAEGVTLLRDKDKEKDKSSARGNVENLDEAITEKQIESSLPRALEDKENALNSMILERIIGFFESHTLKLKLPNVEELQRSLTEEGRKKKKMGGLLAIPLLIGGTLVPLALGALALLAGKALIVSKLALVLASIIGLKKLVSGGGDGGGHEVVQVAGGHGSSGWARSSHELAYSAYKPSSL